MNSLDHLTNLESRFAKLFCERTIMNSIKVLHKVSKCGKLNLIKYDVPVEFLSTFGCADHVNNLILTNVIYQGVLSTGRDALLRREHTVLFSIPTL